MANSNSQRHPRRALAWSISLVAGGALVCMLLLWVLPSLLTRHPSAGLSAAERLKATNYIRVPLVALMVAIGTFGTLILAARTLSLNREGHVTDRFSRSVDQIGSEILEVRIGGLYALERIGHDSSRDRSTIIYLFGSFVRHRSNDGRGQDDEPAEDVYAALSAINRLAPVCDVVLDLRGADLRNAQLEFMKGIDVHLERAVLIGASIPGEWKSSLRPVTDDQSDSRVEG